MWLNASCLGSLRHPLQASRDIAALQQSQLCYEHPEAAIVWKATRMIAGEDIHMASTNQVAGICWVAKT